jgi:hypothetical protein
MCQGAGGPNHYPLCRPVYMLGLDACLYVKIFTKFLADYSVHNYTHHQELMKSVVVEMSLQSHGYDCGMV